VLARPEHVVRFRLEQGDVLWVNNRVMAHNRTGYEDSPGNVRQLQRMWIQCATSQP
jgi:alpha-ketoglutarate-dependent taurine dioxygenase